MPTATQAELQEVQALVAGGNEAALQQIARVPVTVQHETGIFENS